MGLKSAASFENSLHALLGGALKKAPHAEVYAEKGEETTVAFTTDRLKSGKSSSFEGVGLRLIKDGRVGFSSAQGRFDAVDLCRRAATSSVFGEKAAFSFPEHSGEAEAVYADAEVQNLSEGAAVKMGKESIKRLRSFSSSIHVDVSVSKEEKSVYLLNSNGLSKRMCRATHGFFITAILANKTGLLNVYEGAGGTKYENSAHLLVDRMIEKFKASVREISLPAKRMKAVFTPKACFSFLEPFKLAVNGKMIQKGISPLCGKLENKMLSSRLTFYDDPTLDGGLNRTAFDGEGLPARRTCLVENGVIKNYLLDLKTASLLGLSSTGSAVRSFSALPHPGTTHLVIEKSQAPFNDMLAETKEGVLVDQFIGWAANPLAGEFSANVELGFYIKDGELAGRVKDVMVSGNIYESLSEENVLGLSAEQELVFGSALCPYLWLEGMSFSGTE